MKLAVGIMSLVNLNYGGIVQVLAMLLKVGMKRR